MQLNKDFVSSVFACILAVFIVHVASFILKKFGNVVVHVVDLLLRPRGDIPQQVPEPATKNPSEHEWIHD